MVIQLNAVHCGRNPEGKHGNMAMDEPPVGSNWIQLKAKGRTKDLLGSGNAATRRGMNEKPWNLQVNFGDGLLIRPWKIRYAFFFFFFFTCGSRSRRRRPAALIVNFGVGCVTVVLTRRCFAGGQSAMITSPETNK